MPEHSILRLQFHDVDKELFDADDKLLYWPISEYQANKVAQFVNMFVDSCNLLIVQCEAGISRSSGVAAAISKFYLGSDDEYFNALRYQPNRKCFHLVLQALYDYNQKNNE
jgi:predicted protein tyrosine phosphatase